MDLSISFSIVKSIVLIRGVPDWILDVSTSRPQMDSSITKLRIKLSTTSIAVNERGEVMIIDRKTGSYEVYADSVGKMIFDLYAGRMYYESRNK